MCAVIQVGSRSLAASSRSMKVESSDGRLSLLA